VYYRFWRTCFSKADFAAVKETRRSTTGIIDTFDDGAMSWTSRLHKPTALSTTETEIIAANVGSKDLVWFKCLLSELLFDLAIKTPMLYIDNASCITLIKNQQYHTSSKDVDMQHF